MLHFFSSLTKRHLIQSARLWLKTIIKNVEHKGELKCQKTKRLNSFLSKCDEKSQEKIKLISNADILNKIASRIELCNPKDVFIHSGSEEDSEYIKKMCLETGEEADLAMEGHTIHFDPPKEQGRIVAQTLFD